MKNFPHQVNDLSKLHAALGAVKKVIDDGADAGSDKVLGEELARAGVYTFRDRTLTIEQALAAEEKKPRASRGTETAARDIRRLFFLAGLIAPADTASRWNLTDLGSELASSADKLEQLSCWRKAFLGLAIQDSDGDTSHPYQIMLRLVLSVPKIETKKLMLALEAKNDSEIEFQRIAKLAKLQYSKIRDALGVSEASAKNAVKILPSIGRQLGDITESANKTIPTWQKLIATEDAFIAEQQSVSPSPPKTSANLTKVSAANIAKVPVFGELTVTHFDLSESIEMRKERTKKHQSTVKLAAQLFEQHGYELCEQPYDCLCLKQESRPVIIEVKTLDGSGPDERRQAERAVGQLMSYRFFDVPRDVRDSNPIMLVAFDNKPADSTVAFLLVCGVRVTWLEGGNWRTRENDTLRAFLPNLLH